MGSWIKMIDCPKCGNMFAYDDNDLNDKVRTIGCDSCGYEKVIKYGQKKSKPVSSNMEHCELCGTINELGYIKCKGCGD